MTSVTITISPIAGRQVIAVATSWGTGSDLRVQLHAATLIDGGRFLFRTGPGPWENNLRFQLERNAGADSGHLDAATLQLSFGETARFKVTCTPQDLIDMGFCGINRVC